jgi:superfamily II DNA or RNA helicase
VTILAPRKYQQEAIDAVEAAWASDIRRPAVVAATGLGKTVIFSHIAQRYAARTGRRVLVLAHRAELLDQAARKVRDVAPDLRVGTVAAELDETDADILVGSVQTLRLARRRDRLGDVGLIITDEMHHSVAKSYKDVYSHFPDALHLGVTATPNRADGVGLDTFWDQIVADFGILFGIKNGFLADVRGVRVEVADLDLSGVRTTAGDFNDGDLGEAMEMSMAPEVVTAAYLEHAAGRSGLLFAPTIAVAELMGHHLNGAGVVTEVVTGATPKDERRAMLRRFEAGTTRILSNCGVLTEGTDLPIASCILMARPTKSSGLFTQIIGRALRLFPGKDYAVVLDVAGATTDNSLCSLSTLAGRTVKSGQSLAEAADEQDREEGAARVDKPAHAGRVSSREVDLFAAARRRWRKTAGGLPYLVTPVAYLFIFPGAPAEGWTCEDADSDEDCDGCYCHLGHAPCGHCTGHFGLVPSGTYDIGWLATRGGMLNGKYGGDVRTGLSSLSAAMAWAEQCADEADPSGVIGENGRSWHRKPASEKSIGYARSMGIPVVEGMRAVEVSDLIDGHLASRTIDPRILPFLAESGRLPADEQS